MKHTRLNERTNTLYFAVPNNNGSKSNSYLLHCNEGKSRNKKLSTFVWQSHKREKVRVRAGKQTLFENKKQNQIEIQTEIENVYSLAHVSG